MHPFSLNQKISHIQTLFSAFQHTLSKEHHILLSNVEGPRTPPPLPPAGTTAGIMKVKAIENLSTQTELGHELIRARGIKIKKSSIHNCI